MLVTKKNKVFNKDLPTVIKKKPRCKKSRDKFSLMYIMSIQVLSLREEVNSGSKMKRGKRLGFTIYDSLACKQCKPNKFFHKRFSLTLHNKCAHVRDPAFKLPNVSSKSFTVRVELLECNRKIHFNIQQLTLYFQTYSHKNTYISKHFIKKSSQIQYSFNKNNKNN